jgi:hypothetical protein
MSARRSEFIVCGGSLVGVGVGSLVGVGFGVGAPTCSDERRLRGGGDGRSDAASGGSGGGGRADVVGGGRSGCAAGGRSSVGDGGTERERYGRRSEIDRNARESRERMKRTAICRNSRLAADESQNMRRERLEEMPLTSSRERAMPCALRMLLAVASAADAVEAAVSAALFVASHSARTSRTSCFISSASLCRARSASAHDRSMAHDKN